MATSDQVTEFANTYADAAQSAGSQLGVSPDTILAQWGLETGWGQSFSGQNNLGNIQTDGISNNYSSLSDFVGAFVSLIKGNFSGAENTAGSTSAYVNALGAGSTGSYYGSQSPSSYNSSLQGAEMTLQNDAGGVFNNLLVPSTGTETNAGSSLLNTLGITGNNYDPGQLLPKNSLLATPVSTGVLTQPSNLILLALGLLLVFGALIVVASQVRASAPVSTFVNHSKRAFA